MKNNTLSQTNLLQKKSLLTPLLALVALLSLLVALNVHAANQTWTNAPQNAVWNNTNNWVLKVVPGALNTTTVTDVVTFNSPITNGIGTVGNAITVDLTRGVRGFIFDTSACGALCVWEYH